MSGDREEVRIIKLKIQIRVSGESEPPEIREKKKRFHHSFIPRSAKYLAALQYRRLNIYSATFIHLSRGPPQIHINSIYKLCTAPILIIVSIAKCKATI